MNRAKSNGAMQQGGGRVQVGEMAVEAARIDDDVDAAVRLAVRAAATLPQPGSGHTWERWSVLASVARADLTTARVLEAHSDALAILSEAGEDAAGASGSWGVFAAESVDTRLVAAPSTGADGAPGSVTLDGVKPWCSLGGILDHALVTAHTDDGRRLFRVRLDQPGVSALPAERWVARGLRAVTSVPLSFSQAAATPVGAPGWYLTRPGFAWGGMGVAACWLGGAQGLADTLLELAHRRPGELTSMHVGRVDSVLHAARTVLADAAQRIDAGAADGAAGATLALQVRAVVADAAEQVLRTVGHALGPAPLAFDAAHAARVADLEIYVRQHHAERDLAHLGDTLLASSAQAGR